MEKKGHCTIPNKPVANDEVVGETTSSVVLPKMNGEANLNKTSVDKEKKKEFSSKKLKSSVADGSKNLKSKFLKSNDPSKFKKTKKMVNGNPKESKPPLKNHDHKTPEAKDSKVSEGKSKSLTSEEAPEQNGLSDLDFLKGKAKPKTIFSSSRPESPMSENSLDLEEKLLHIDTDIPNDDQDEFCEETLLQDNEEELLSNDKSKKEETKASKSKSFPSDKSLSEQVDDRSSERQDKEIEKILNNLNSSLENKAKNRNSDSTTFRKITTSKSNSQLTINSAENSKCHEDSGNASQNESNSDSSKDSKQLTISRLSDITSSSSSSNSSSSSSNNTLPKRSSSSSNTLPKRKFTDINNDTDSNSSGKSPKSDNTKNSGKTNKKIDKKSSSLTNSSTKGNPKKIPLKNATQSAITFSEALKSIALEDKLMSLDKPQPLVPTTEVHSEVIAPSSSLIILQPASKKNSSSSLSVDIDSESQGKKRTLSESNLGSLKPDLKKFRICKEADKKNSTTEDVTEEISPKEVSKTLNLEEIAKKVEMTKSLESRLQEDKEVFISKNIVEKKNISQDERMMMIDQEDLERRTVEELRKANLGNNKLRRIKRKDLEGLIIELFIDKVLYEHQLGQHKDLCKRLETTLETNRKKAAQFHKEIEDLKKVTQRLQAEHLARKSQLVAPVKVKRSVGIQATPTIIGKGLMNVSSNSNFRVLSPSASAISPMNNRAGNKNLNQGMQTAIVNATQPMSFAGSQQNSGTQMMVVNPLVVQQSQNGNVGSQFIPVTTTRIVRTPLTPISSSSTHLTTSATGTSVGGGTSSTSSLIDLTDDDEAAKNHRASLQAGGLVAIQRSTAAGLQNTPGQFVALNPPTSVGQLLLVPSAPGQPTTALVVGNVPSSSSNNSGVMRTSVPQSSSVRISSPVSIVNTASRTVVGTQMNGGSFVSSQVPRHPAPLPRAPPQQTSGYSKKLPPLPTLKLSHKENSIVLSWNMDKTDEHERIASYQIYAYQEGTAPPTPALWKKVGSVKALELPMACTLTQFMPGHVYHFAVRAVDIRSRLGPFSDPKSIRLGK